MHALELFEISIVIVYIHYFISENTSVISYALTRFRMIYNNLPTLTCDLQINYLTFTLGMFSGIIPTNLSTMVILKNWNFLKSLGVGKTRTKNCSQNFYLDKRNLPFSSTPIIEYSQMQYIHCNIFHHCQFLQLLFCS